MDEFFVWDQYVRNKTVLKGSAPRQRRKQKGSLRAATTGRVVLIARAFQTAADAIKRIPGVTMMEAFPWCMRVLLATDRVFASEILQDARYQAWFAGHTTVINRMESIGADLRGSAPREDDDFNDLYDALDATKQITKVPRYVKVEPCTVSEAWERMMDSNLFFAAQALLDFEEQQNEECMVLQFPNSSRLDVIGTMNKVSHNMPMLSPPYNHEKPYRPQWLVHSATTSMSECVMILPKTTMREVRLWLVGDLITDASAIRKHTTRLAPMFAWSFHNGGDRMKYIVLRTLLRFVSVSRVMGKGIWPPSHPGFSLYRYLPSMLALFDVKSALASSYAAENIHLDGKNRADRFKTEAPTLMRAIKSFLQQELPHETSPSLLLQVREELLTNHHLKTQFSLLLDVIDTLVPHNYLNKPVELRHVSIRTSDGITVPSHWLLYSFALSPLVSEEMRRRVFLDITVEGNLPVPRPVKHISLPQTPRGWALPERRGTKRKAACRGAVPKHKEEKAFYDLFIVLERLSFRPFHLPKGDIDNPSSVYRGNYVYDDDDAEESYMPSWPSETTQFLMRVATDTEEEITSEHVWVHRWPEYNCSFVGTNPYFLELLVYDHRFAPIVSPTQRVDGSET